MGCFLAWLGGVRIMVHVLKVLLVAELLAAREFLADLVQIARHSDSHPALSYKHVVALFRECFDLHILQQSDYFREQQEDGGLLVDLLQRH